MPKYHYRVMGFLALHITNCNNADCKCRSIKIPNSGSINEEQFENKANKLSKERKLSLSSLHTSGATTPQSANGRRHIRDEFMGQGNKFYKLLVKIINRTEHMDTTPCPLLLQKAYIQAIFLHKKELSMYTISKQSILNQNLWLQFLMYSIK